MITIQQAQTLNKFHAVHIPYAWELVNVNTNIAPKCLVYRRNGQTQTWKTRPTEFRIPTKHGLRAHIQITQKEADKVYAPQDCPVCHGTKN